MSDSYYFRSKGKVLGPFSFEDLKTKAGKRHLKKTDQVSTDNQKTWQAARRVEGLFPAPPKVPQKPKAGPAPPSRGEPELVEVNLFEDEPLEVVEAEDGTEWHYCLQGDSQTQGPVSETQLRRMFQSGQLPQDTLVWNESLPDWIESTRIPAFQSAPAGRAKGRPAIPREVALLDTDSPSAATSGIELPVPPLASASLILGILGIAIPIGVPSVLAIVFGHLSLNQIKTYRGLYQGENMAKSGLILGYAVLTILLVFGSVLLLLRLAKS